MYLTNMSQKHYHVIIHTGPSTSLQPTNFCNLSDNPQNSSHPVNKQQILVTLYDIWRTVPVQHTTQNTCCNTCLLTSLLISCQAAAVPSVDSKLIDVSSYMRLGRDLPQFHTDLTDLDSCVPVVSAVVPVVPTLILTARTVIVRISCLCSMLLQSFNIIAVC